MEIEPVRRPIRGVSRTVAAAAAASVGAGVVHAAAAGSHSSDRTLAWLFAGCAVAQIAWAAAVLASPRRMVLAAGIVLNGVAALSWALSRTVGLFGPLAGVEPVGAQDLVAAALGLLAAAAAGAALFGILGTARIGVPTAAVMGSIALALALPATAAPHAHGHDHEDEAAAQHEHAADHDDDPAAEHDHASEHDDAAAPAGPIVSVDDRRLTDAQRERAEDLLEATREAMGAFTDEAGLVAAGYSSIGDGRRPGSFEHFVNPEYMADGRELDPDRIESIVVQRQADGSKTVMSAMYILDRGDTMADVPDIAGELTTWHDHRNLCWDETGTRLAGILVDGTCRPGGTLRATAPMLHVWLADTPCGPFAGIEGHGGSCAHSHAPA